MSAGKRIRQLQRYRTIATAFARNGLGYVSHEMGLTEKILFFRSEERKELQAKSVGERIRLLLEELGPTFVKLGQIASTRPDLVPADILAELERLQDKVPPFPYAEVSRILEEELGAPIESLFLQFSDKPLAAASIGQVYRACLQDGTAVVVKVQRPDIQSLIETDLDILADWARLAEGRLEWARNYRLREIVDELGKALRAEIDYTAEARNAEKFAAQSKTLEHVHVPAVYWDYSTKRVLTMAYIEGIKLSDREQLDRVGLDRRLLAERFASTIFHQVLVEGFFHGDPHPGNVLALPDGSLALLDFGMVGRLSPGMKKQFASFVIALRNQSSKGVIRAISNMGMIPDDVDRDALNADVDKMREKYYQVPLNQISLGVAVNDLFSVAFRHQIRIPTELTLLGKSLLTMEGVVSALDPTFSVFDVAEPFGKKLFLERLDPRQMLKNWIEDVPEYFDLISEVPLSLKQLSMVLRQGKLRIEVASPQVDALMKKMDRISNRLSFSIVLLSLSIVMVGLIIGAALSHSQTMLWRIPIIEIGFVIALFMFMWLIFAILRSGRF
ncbi:AarF/ABC1/UbiB kinase family protein [Paenibacillus validus]|uniref:ABC transporter n=1 Tax=Paenibacillus validus TaxID=44253 RepID=A0A7X2Z8Z8_9BACL|nr:MULTISPECIES: AarF/ABC1/UbiB kinase family protein [Paenibacillus]MED4600621.1 AarF/ABC1/UbiB kinase family protein [Paenibacillus validus]MED4606254.1 AarF/ABC1/UbiB kinase family protein [Paenibacillus validus]MUG69920.1 ABC transporter [Paenibacillus validus]